MTEDQLRDWIRANVQVEVSEGHFFSRLHDRYENRVTVRLRIKGDAEAFSEDYFVIEEQHDQ